MKDKMQSVGLEVITHLNECASLLPFLLLHSVLFVDVLKNPLSRGSFIHTMLGSRF